MKMTYDTHFKSTRDDGRFYSTMAAQMQKMRDAVPALAFPENISKENFDSWRASVKEKMLELMCLPAFTEQPAPVRISTVKREGYHVERWEFYPDDYAVVPFLILIPDTATKETPAPGVLCFPGSVFSKESLAGEPLLDSPKCRFNKYPDRNPIAKHMVENGMVAFAFDNPETAEVALHCEMEGNYYQSRSQMCHGILQNGESYFGISFFQKLCFMKILKQFDFVDQSRLAVAGHSLGCDDVMRVALACDEIRAVVFNDFVCDERHRYFSITEYEETAMSNDSGIWHIVPGQFRYFSRVDILCALAPKYLCLNEGGAEYHLDMIRKAYALNGASDHLQISHYPKYKDESSRSAIYEPPMYGLSDESYFEYSNVDAPDHSFRREPSVMFLKRVFEL